MGNTLGFPHSICHRLILGLQWNNIWKTSSPDDNLTLGYLMIMLIIDALIYLLVAVYVEAIFPGEYGVPQVWYFPLTLTYWCGKTYGKKVQNIFQLAKD